MGSVPKYNRSYFFWSLATAFCGITVFCSPEFVCVDKPDENPPVACLGRYKLILHQCFQTYFSKSKGFFRSDADFEVGDAKCDCAYDLPKMIWNGVFCLPFLHANANFISVRCINNVMQYGNNSCCGVHCGHCECVSWSWFLFTLSPLSY